MSADFEPDREIYGIELIELFQGRIDAAAQRGRGFHVTAEDKSSALALALEWTDAASRHGLTLDDLDAVGSITTKALDAVTHARRRVEGGDRD